jgi:DNA polymerase gamma 1
MGWMALRGTKSQGTDVHSRTAALVGIDRNTAKIFNYGRIYGAGIRFAEKLLLQHNRGMTAAEATDKAAHLYKNTKGTRWYRLDARTASRIRAESPGLPMDGDWCVRGGAHMAMAVMGCYSRSWANNGGVTCCRAPRDTLEQHFKGRLPWYRMNQWASEWRGGTESYMFNALERIANGARPVTPVLHSPLSAVVRKDVADNGYLTSRVNWVVQSSAVDYLHLMLVSMRYLCSTYKIDARFSISIHDEVRYLVREEDVDRAALALHYTNLFVRAMFAARLGMHDLPAGIAFFEAVDIDTVLRKEVHMDCITPSHPTPIPHGRAVDMYDCYVTTGARLSPPRAHGHASQHPSLLPGWDSFAAPVSSTPTLTRAAQAQAQTQTCTRPAQERESGLIAPAARLATAERRRGRASRTQREEGWQRA